MHPMGALHAPRLRWLAVALLVSVWLPLVSRAETTSPKQVEAGPEEREFRLREKPTAPPERKPVVIEEQLAPPTEPVGGRAGPTFTVRTIRIEGSALIPPRERVHLVAPYEGRALTLDTLQRLAIELTQWLRQHGYVTSRAYIPPQEVTSGIVRIQVLEGRVGEVRVEGARYTSPATAIRWMRTSPGSVLEYQILQRDLARLNANPDRRASAVLVPGSTTGTTDVVVQLQERFPIHAVYVMHNQGTKLTGRLRQGFTIEHSSLTGHDDQLTVRGELSGRSDFTGLNASYLFPLGPSGRTLRFDVSRADVKLNRHFRESHVIGNATVLGFTWSEPLWQREHWEAEWATGFDWKRIRSRETGIERGKDDLRVLRLGPTILEHDATGRSLATTEVGIGFDQLLGASHKVDSAASRSQTGGQFTRVGLAGGRLQKLPGGLQVVAHGSCQLTNQRLPPPEMIRLGGENTVRGYPEGEILGDYGYVGTVELRVPTPVKTRGADSPLTLLGFVDGGAAFARKAVLGEDQKKRLVGVGLGVRWALTDRATLLLDVGWPVGNDSSEGSRPRLSFSYTLGL